MAKTAQPQAAPSEQSGGPSTIRLMLILAVAGAYATLAPSSVSHTAVGLGASLIAMACCSLWLKGQRRRSVLALLALATGVAVVSPLIVLHGATARTFADLARWAMSAGLVSTAAFAIARGRSGTGATVLLGSGLVHTALAGAFIGASALGVGGTISVGPDRLAHLFYVGWLPVLSVCTLWLARARSERATLLGWLFAGAALAPAMLLGSMELAHDGTQAAVTTALAILLTALLGGVFASANDN